MSHSLAIIIPACDEAPCLTAMLDELAPWAKKCGAVIAVGLNDCSDSSRAVLGAYPGVVIGEVAERGYGQGCLAAIRAVRDAGHAPAAWLFMSADGANDPAQLASLIEHWRNGADLVLGQRTLQRENLATLGALRVVSNIVLGAWATILSGRLYADLGPFRLVSERLLSTWLRAPGNLRWGWTIEPQILAPLLGLRVCCVPVSERPRIAGEQKVNGVSLRHSLRIGAEIISAGWRAREKVPAISGARLSC